MGERVPKGKSYPLHPSAEKIAQECGRRYNREKQQGVRTDLTSGKNYQKSTSAEEIADAIGIPRTTIEGWLADSDWQSDFAKVPESRQHFDVWNFQQLLECQRAQHGLYF
jgi:hypothetical protein